MRPELREKVLTYNRAIKERGSKAADLETLIAKFMELPPGQLKQVLTEDVLEILRRYNVQI